MAEDSSFGFRLIKTSGSAPNNIVPTEYYIADDYGTALFVGDPVVVTGDDMDVRFMDRDIGELQVIERAGETGAVTGVIVGFVENEDVSDTVLHNPASTERIALVCDDPNAEFEVQCDGTLSGDDLGNNTNCIFTNAGSTATGISGAELDISDIGTTATLQFKILRVARPDRPGQDNSIGANTNVVVKINNHTQAPNTAGIA